MGVKKGRQGLLGGSGHELTVRGTEPCVGLCADGAEPAGDALSLSLPYSLSLKNKQIIIIIIIIIAD